MPSADQEVYRGGVTLWDAGFITAFKLGVEEFGLRVPFVGDGTLRSGGLKLAGSFVTNMLSKNKYAQYAAAGMMIDGVEDIFTAIREGNFSLAASSGNGNSQENAVIV